MVKGFGKKDERHEEMALAAAKAFIGIVLIIVVPSLIFIIPGEIFLPAFIFLKNSFKSITWSQIVETVSFLFLFIAAWLIRRYHERCRMNIRTYKW